MKNKKYKKYGAVFLFCISIVTLLAFFTTVTTALTDTVRPNIISTTPTNNALGVPTDQVIEVTFSEPMDRSTINTETFILIQQTTPYADADASSYRSRQIEGFVSYNGNTATFTPLRDEQNPLQPSQEYGNVFTAKITTGARDTAGNSLAQDYMWSFSTGLLQFNTGAATSQLGQEVTPNSPAAVTPQTTPASNVVTNPATTNAGTANTQTNDSRGFSWGWTTWIIAGALIIIFALLITMAVASSNRDKKKTVVKTVKTVNKEKDDSFGDVYPVKNIEGIGATFGARLQTIGITNTKELWKANSAKTAHAIDASAASVKSWQNMAELGSIKGIGPQYAELLERSGIHNIKQLREYDSKELLRAINKKQNSLEVNIQGNSPGMVAVENWIDEARSHTISRNEGQTA